MELILFFNSLIFVTKYLFQYIYILYCVVYLMSRANNFNSQTFKFQHINTAIMSLSAADYVSSCHVTSK